MRSIRMRTQNNTRMYSSVARSYAILVDKLNLEFFYCYCFLSQHAPQRVNNYYNNNKHTECDGIMEIKNVWLVYTPYALNLSEDTFLLVMLRIFERIRIKALSPRNFSMYQLREKTPRHSWSDATEERDDRLSQRGRKPLSRCWLDGNYLNGLPRQLRGKVFRGIRWSALKI